MSDVLVVASYVRPVQGILCIKMSDVLVVDQTQDEFAAAYLALQPESLCSELPHLGTLEYSGVALPSSVCWTTRGVVTPLLCP